MLKVRALIFWFTVGFFIFAWVPVLWADDTEMININTASAVELMQLKGIAEKRAEKIVKFRETHGPFKTPEDLVKVPGIGPKTYEANKGHIAVE